MTPPSALPSDEREETTALGIPTASRFDTGSTGFRALLLTTWPHRRMIWVLRSTALALALVQAWAFRYEANPDGVSYLDIADAYREGRWSDAVNGYWSPLYPGLLAAFGAVLGLPSSADFVLAHIVNVAAFIAALAAFEYFLRGIERYTGSRVDGPEGRRRDWVLLAYALFVWATLGLIGLGMVTPDLLVSAAAFLAAGILVRMRALPGDLRHAIGLGVATGTGYLAKAAFFPLTAVFLCVGVALWMRSHRALTLSVVAVASFAIIGLPHAIVLSRAKGRPTFGESGRLAYAWMVNNVPGQVHWQGNGQNAGAPRHPTRKIFSAPETFEFGTPLIGTYPPWYDPSYWYDGVRVRPDLPAQMRRTFHYLPLILELLAPLLLIAIATLAASRTAQRSSSREWTRGSWLIAPGLAAIAMYASVFLEPRYVAPFVVMMWVGLLLVLEPLMPANWRRGFFGGAAVVLFASTIPNLSPSVGALLPGKANAHWEDARFVLGSGVRPGDRIAVIGDGTFAYWARLARVRIVAEVPPGSAPEFFAASQARRDSLLQLLRASGVQAIVSLGPWRVARNLGWQMNSRLGVLRLATQDAETESASKQRRPAPPTLLSASSARLRDTHRRTIRSGCRSRPRSPRASRPC